MKLKTIAAHLRFEGLLSFPKLAQKNNICYFYMHSYDIFSLKTFIKAVEKI